MSLTLSQVALPTLDRLLANLRHFLDRAEASAQERGFSSDAFVTSRLAPDMLPFAAQIRIACDAAKLGVARLAGREAPVFTDDETTVAQLMERIDRTLEWLRSVPADALDGREAQSVTFQVGRSGSRTMQGDAYIQTWVLPNVYFHVVTAYALLRHNGVVLGKLDYLAGAAQSA